MTLTNIMFTPKNMVGVWPENVHNNQPYFFNLTEIHDTDKHYVYTKKYAGAVSLDRSPSLASLLYKKKKSGTEVRRTLDVRLR